MRSFLAPVVALTSLLALSGCAAPVDEDAGSASGAMNGSPGEPAVAAELLRRNRWLQSVAWAYDAAVASDFTALPPDGTGLVGEARAAFADTARACTATSGRAVAHTWKVSLAASPEDPTVKMRKYFLLSTIDRAAHTIAVGIHDESGVFVMGRLYGFGGRDLDDWEPDTGPRFGRTFRRCAR